MKIAILFTGKTKPAYIDQGLQDYVRRLLHYSQLQIIEIQDQKKTKGIPQQTIMEQEGDKILRNIRPEDYVVLLDERGKQLSSKELAGWIEEKALHSQKRIVFVTGGAFGFGKKVYDRANMLLSVSKMTFSHQVIRLFFMEQLYRAFTILRGEPYLNG